MSRKRSKINNPAPNTLIPDPMDFINMPEGSVAIPHDPFVYTINETPRTALYRHNDIFQAFFLYLLQQIQQHHLFQRLIHQHQQHLAHPERRSYSSSHLTAHRQLPQGSYQSQLRYHRNRNHPYRTIQSNGASHIDQVLLRPLSLNLLPLPIQQWIQSSIESSSRAAIVTVLSLRPMLTRNLSSPHYVIIISVDNNNNNSSNQFSLAPIPSTTVHSTEARLLMIISYGVTMSHRDICNLLFPLL